MLASALIVVFTVMFVCIAIPMLLLLCTFHCSVEFDDVVYVGVDAGVDIAVAHVVADYVCVYTDDDVDGDVAMYAEVAVAVTLYVAGVFVCDVGVGVVVADAAGVDDYVVSVLVDVAVTGAVGIGADITIDIYVDADVEVDVVVDITVYVDNMPLPLYTSTSSSPSTT